MLHDWVPSKLGHGETMCARCFVTNREAAALGISNLCDAPAAPPKPPANENAPQWSQDQIDAKTRVNGYQGATMPLSDPQSRHLTPAHFRAGQWKCPSCESANGEDDDLCWNCGATREGLEPEKDDDLGD